jgi:hypothetical protein
VRFSVAPDRTKNISPGGVDDLTDHHMEESRKRDCSKIHPSPAAGTVLLTKLHIEKVMRLGLGARESLPNSAHYYHIRTGDKRQSPTLKSAVAGVVIGHSYA